VVDELVEVNICISVDLNNPKLYTKFAAPRMPANLLHNIP